MITRRRALAGFLAAPAIVRAESIMRVRTPPLVMAPMVLPLGTGRYEVVFKMFEGRRCGDFIRLARAT